MNKSELLVEILAELRPTTSLPVNTEGDDGDEKIPSLALGDISTRRISDGHQTYVGTTKNQQDIETGTVHHLVWRATVNVIVKTTDEEERDDELQNVADTFAVLEDLPHEWNADVRVIQVESQSPQSLPFREPDLYSGGQRLTFEYVQELSSSAEALETVTEVIDPDYTVSETI